MGRGVRERAQQRHKVPALRWQSQPRAGAILLKDIKEERP